MDNVIVDLALEDVLVINVKLISGAIQTWSAKVRRKLFAD